MRRRLQHEQGHCRPGHLQHVGALCARALFFGPLLANASSIFWGVTAFYSIYSVKYYQFNGHLPGYDRGAAKGSQNIDPDMAAFSTAPHDEELYARINNMDPDYDHDPRDPHDYRSDVGASAVAGSSYANPGSHVDSSYLGAGGLSHVGSVSAVGGGSSVASHAMENPFDDGHGLHPAASHGSLGTSVSHGGYMPPTVHDAYDEDRPARFPDAEYDRH